MSILKALFSKDQVIDSLSAGVDKAFYTKEEKSDDFITMIMAYSAFKLAQRVFATLLLIPYIFVLIMAASVYTSSIFFDPCAADITVCKSSQLKSTAEGLSAMITGTLQEAITWVVVFYFGGGAVEGVVAKVRSREPDKK